MDSHGEKNSIKKYLAIYSDDQFIDINNLKLRTYSHVLVIPAFLEDYRFIENLRQFSERRSECPLIIVVVNQPRTSTPDDAHINEHLINMLCDGSENVSCNQHARLIIMKNLSILVTESLILDEKKGVGLARKIGCDLALRLIDIGVVRCPIIYTTDADANLPTDYFSRAEEALSTNTAAFVYPFSHLPEDDVRVRSASMLYEKRLSFYVEGLKKAHSPYAFHTIGSTIAVFIKSYAMVRGFPKMSAGEDFYLLNKLKKVGEIISLTGDPILLSARRSSRVPFGTGPALSYILQHDDPKEAPIFYHPGVFSLLGNFLAHTTQAILQGRSEQPFSGNLSTSTDLIQQAACSLRGYEQLYEHLCSRRTASDRLKAFHDWFDAFRTLKFIHFLKNRGFFMCNAKEIEIFYKTESSSLAI